MQKKDSYYYRTIIEGLEETIKSVDSNAVRYREENVHIKLSKAYRISKHLAMLGDSLRKSTVGKGYRFLKRSYRKARLFSQHKTSATKRPVDEIMHSEYNVSTRTEEQDKKILVGLVLRDGNIRPQSSAFIRLVAPLTTQPLDKKVQLHVFGEDISADTDEQKSIDIFIVQRTAFSTLAKAKLFYENVKKNDAKLVIDLDDALGMLDKSHEQFIIQHKCLEALDFLVNNCDQLWCSTNKIAEYYSDISTKTIVVRNAIDAKKWPNLTPPNLRLPAKSSSEPLKILYMGTRTHLGDYNMIAPAFDRLHAIAPGSFEVTVIGVSGSISARPYVKRLQPPQELTVYPRFTKWFSDYQDCFDIGISPLEDTPFNQAKSDIKCVDYLAIRAMPMLSSLSPYLDSDLIPYALLVDNTVDAWTDALLGLVQNPDILAEHRVTVEKGYEFVLKNRSVSQISTILDKQIEELTGKK